MIFCRNIYSDGSGRPPFPHQSPLETTLPPASIPSPYLQVVEAEQVPNGVGGMADPMAAEVGSLQPLLQGQHQVHKRACLSGMGYDGLCRVLWVSMFKGQGGCKR